MTFPQISIVLPSYNRAQYLGKTIESCLNQAFTDFELIIVDDCSIDDSLAIAQGYAQYDKRITVIANQVNKKLPATLNIGFEKARGKYYTWISDDNLYHPQALQKMSYYLDNMSDIGLVYADYTLINEDGKEGCRIYQEPPEFLPIRDCVGACFLYRARLAKLIQGYNEQMFLVEDYEYWLRLGLITKFFHIKESLYFYRIHPRNLTSTRRLDIRKGKRALKEMYLHKYQVSKKNQPILALYLWFIEDKTPISYIKLLKIIFANPISTLSYIFKNLTRL